MKKMKIPAAANRRDQQGTSLLEVLIAIVVVALGLLGFAGLQVASLKSSNTAYYRSQATMLAYDVIDRMRVNRKAAVTDGLYNINYGQAGTGDVTDWRTNVVNSLPGGNAKILVNSANGSAEIYMKWDDGGGEVTEFVTTTNI
jgi:type IV pilus assembly protein PilV